MQSGQGVVGEPGEWREPTEAEGSRLKGALQRQKAQVLNEDTGCGMGARDAHRSLVTPDTSSRGVPGADERLQGMKMSQKRGVDTSPSRDEEVKAKRRRDEERQNSLALG